MPEKGKLVRARDSPVLGRGRNFTTFHICMFSEGMENLQDLQSAELFGEGLLLFMAGFFVWEISVIYCQDLLFDSRFDERFLKDIIFFSYFSFYDLLTLLKKQ